MKGNHVLKLLHHDLDVIRKDIIENREKMVYKNNDHKHPRKFCKTLGQKSNSNSERCFRIKIMNVNQDKNYIRILTS